MPEGTGDHLVRSGEERADHTGASLCRQVGLSVTGFASAIWPDERGWKLKVEFSRTDHFAVQETWTLRGLPVGPSDLAVLSNPLLDAQGVILTNLELRALPPMQIRPERNSPNREVKLGFTPPRGLRIDLHKVIDSRGRELTCVGGLQLPDSTYSARFHAYPDSGSVDLIFAVHRSHFVEFLVRPEFLSHPPSALPALVKPATSTPR